MNIEKPEEIIIDVPKQARHAANVKICETASLMRFSKTVSDNPYDRSLEKRNHVLWHNSFTAECRKLGRRLL